MGCVLFPRLERHALPCLVHNQATLRKAGAVPTYHSLAAGPGTTVSFGPVQRPAAHVLHDHCVVKLGVPSRMVRLVT